MKATPSLLIKIVSALLEEWDRDTIIKCVNEASNTTLSSDNKTYHKDIKKNELNINTKKSQNITKRPNATDYLARINVDLERKSFLHSLAQNFDDKTFLPRTADVKNFLALKGRHDVFVKQRTDAIRILFTLISEMPADKIKKLLDDIPNQGPSSLGPLSEAIAASSQSIRSSEEKFRPTVKLPIGTHTEPSNESTSDQSSTAERPSPPKPVASN